MLPNISPITLQHHSQLPNLIKVAVSIADMASAHLKVELIDN